MRKGAYPVFAEERRQKIAEMIKSGKSTTVAELAKFFDISESTIRRDLQFLEDQGYIQRTHGGAIDIARSHYEPTIFEKEALEASSKQEIGVLAAQLVKEGDTILLDSGTTTLIVAKNLKGKNLRITVLTNSPVIALELSTEEQMEVVLIGGILRKATRALVGPMAERSLTEFRVDKAFMGANGITLYGVTTPDITEAGTKRAMVQIASEVYVVADHTKFGVSTFVKFADLQDVVAIITDREIDRGQVAAFEEQGVEIIYPKEKSVAKG